MPTTTNPNCSTSVYATETICPNKVYTTATAADVMMAMLTSSPMMTLRLVPEERRH